MEKTSFKISKLISLKIVISLTLKIYIVYDLSSIDTEDGVLRRGLFIKIPKIRIFAIVVNILIDEIYLLYVQKLADRQ